MIRTTICYIIASVLILVSGLLILRSGSRVLHGIAANDAETCAIIHDAIN